MLIRGEFMDLRDYLYIKRMTINEFSELIGYSRTHISGIINGKIKPTKKFAQYIEKVTDGEIKSNELLEMKPQHKKRLTAEELLKEKKSA